MSPKRKTKWYVCRENRTAIGTPVFVRMDLPACEKYQALPGLGWGSRSENPDATCGSCCYRESISFSVPGEPVPMPRARHSRVGKFVRTYTPAHATSHKGTIALAWQQAIKRLPVSEVYLSSPVALDIVVHRLLPKSMPRWQQAMVYENAAFPDATGEDV